MRTLAVILLLASAAIAGESFEAEHSRLEAGMPEGVRVQIRAPTEPVPAGDPIPLGVVYRNTSGESYAAEMPRAQIDRLPFLESVRISGPGLEEWVHPVHLATWRAQPLRRFPLPAGMPRFDGVDLADSIRFDAPGRYRIFLAGDFVSPILEIEIAPGPEGWPDAAIADAAAPLTGGDDEARLAAAALLDRAGTTAALALLRSYLEDPVLAGRAQHAFLRARDPEAARRLLAEGLAAAKLPVGPTYLETLANLENAPAEKGVLTVEARRDLLRRLDAALPEKDVAALPPSVRLLAGAFVELDAPEHLPAATARAWPALSVPERAQLLTGPFFRRVAGPALADRLAAEADANDGEELASLSARRLFELDPARGREAILADLARPAPRYAAETLLALPDERLPSLTPAFAASLRDRERRDLGKLGPLVERYGAADLVPAVVEVLREAPEIGREAQTALLRFVLRNDRAAGLAAVAAAAQRRGGDRSGSGTVLGDVLGPLWAPDAEPVAIRFLDDPDPAVVRNAAGLLVRHGGPASTAPLIDLFDRLDPAAPAEGKLRLEIVLALAHRDLDDAARTRLRERLATDEERQILGD